MVSTTTLLIGFGACVLTLVAVIVLLCVLWWQERTRLISTIERLLTLYKSRTVGEYAAARTELDTRPADRQREIELENELAMAAQAAQEEYTSLRPE